jgi:hypothetical protein
VLVAETFQMDPTSAVRTDTLPAIATVVAPGAFVSSTYLWAILSSDAALRTFLDHHEAIALASALLLWIVAGFAVDSIGSYVEVYWIDRPREDHSQMLEVWWRYLRIAWSREPIGQRYLRRLLVSFKFELNMFTAALGTMPGVIALGFLGRIGALTAATATVGLCLTSAALFNMAQGTAQVLADVRERLVRGVGEPPFDANGNPRPSINA